MAYEEYQKQSSGNRFSEVHDSDLTSLRDEGAEEL